MKTIRCEVCGKYLSSKEQKHHCLWDVEILDKNGELLSTAKGRNLNMGARKALKASGLWEQRKDIRPIKAQITIDI